MPTLEELAQQVEQLDDVQWYDFLDMIDEIARRRRRDAPDDEPAGTSRDEVAAWLAKTHLITDTGIREVWYLPEGGPPDEIRLLEVKDRIGDDDADVEPFDFRLNLGIEGVNFRLLVADVTSDQLERIKRDPGLLPPGWSLEGSRIRGRRG